ncbi:Hypothetical predicted protein [Podarcis lilfordi]|uniref:Dynein axonemal heavy chain 1 n=1 Tax=Podarcis lilfordi TaxID=74358 RepID=A0AA35QQD8_9SAUR|nr:Hypothetical predicted protein [Podarcis lilfordi]
MDKVKKELTESLGRSPYPPYPSSQGSESLPGTSKTSSGSKKYPPIKERGFYSDVLTPGALDLLGDVSAGPNVYRDLLKQSEHEDHTPKVTTFETPENIESILNAQQIGPTTEIIKETDFPLQSYKPKVQVPFEVIPGQCPRKIAIERLRRLYLSLDITQLLEMAGIDSNELMPRHQDPDNMPTIEQKNDPLFPVYLPLQIFDNEEYDCRTPEEWLLLGVEPESEDRKPIPGKALLPTDDELGHEDPKSRKLIYKWIDVGVLDYDEETKFYLVHKTNSLGLVRDAQGKRVLNGGMTEEGRAPLMPCQYWVPRVRLLFLAEDPRVLAERVISANDLRKKTQALLLYNLYVDCMPLDGMQTIEEKSLQRMKQMAMETSRLRKGSIILERLQLLGKEVSLDFERTMNKINFDRIVTSKPQTFYYVTLPEKEEEKVPQKGRIDVPEYPFNEQKETFSFISLLTRPEVIMALCQVRDECNKTAAMSLFHSTLTKYGRLEEFEQIQKQTFSQV